MTNWAKSILVAMAIFSVGGIAGYFVGRSRSEVTTRTEKIYTWSKGAERIKEIPIPQPYEVIKTVEKVVSAEVDTAALYAVWLKYHDVNKYEFDFSDDGVGVFKVDFSVSKNEVISKPRATIQPNTLTVTETKTIYKVPTIQGWAMIGADLKFNTFQIQGGVDFKQRFMLGAGGIRMNDAWGYTVNLGIKF